MAKVLKNEEIKWTEEMSLFQKKLKWAFINPSKAIQTIFMISNEDCLNFVEFNKYIKLCNVLFDAVLIEEEATIFLNYTLRNGDLDSVTRDLTYAWHKDPTGPNVWSSYTRWMRKHQVEMYIFYKNVTSRLSDKEGFTEGLKQMIGGYRMDADVIFKELHGSKYNNRCDVKSREFINMVADFSNYILDCLENPPVVEAQDSVKEAVEEASKLASATKETVVINSQKIDEDKSVRKAVNQLDEDMGLDLKHPCPIVDTEELYMKEIRDWQVRLTEIICLLNDLDVNKYLTEDIFKGVILRKIRINGDDELDIKFDSSSCNPEDMKFRIQFLTRLLNYCVLNIRSIVKYLVKMYGDESENIYMERDKYLRELINTLVDLSSKILSNESVTEELGRLQEAIIYLNRNISRSDKVELIDFIGGNFHDLSEMTKGVISRIIHRNDFKGLLLVQVYAAVTADLETALELPFMNDNFSFKKFGNSKKAILHLGHMIRVSKNRNPLFKMYLLSSPLIHSKWRKQDTDLAIGITALYYYAFISNDKGIVNAVKSLVA